MEVLQSDLQEMLKSIFKYGAALLTFSLVGILAMDYVILPNYVGYDNEHYYD